MSIRSLIVHVDDHDAALARTDVAIRLARNFDAELLGLYAVSTPEIPPSVAALLPSEVLTERLRETGEAQYRAEGRFRDAAAIAGLSSVQWSAPAGNALEAALAYACSCDLAILGQADPDDSDASFLANLTTGVMLSCGRPTLVVPYIGPRPTLGERVLVAWDGRREASRALGDALPLLERAKEVVILTVSPEPDRPALSDIAQERLANYLRVRHVEPRIEKFDGRDRDVAAWLLSRAADLGIDLMVMGGYGHSRLQEMVLGGVTRSVLQSMTVPVLMAH